MSTFHFFFGGEVLPVTTTTKETKSGKESVEKAPVLEESAKQKVEASKT